MSCCRARYSTRRQFRSRCHSPPARDADLRPRAPDQQPMQPCSPTLPCPAGRSIRQAKPIQSTKQEPIEDTAGLVTSQSKQGEHHDSIDIHPVR